MQIEKYIYVSTIHQVYTYTWLVMKIEFKNMK